MSKTDPIADYLTRIRNAAKAKHRRVDIPSSNLKKAISKILLEKSFIAGFWKLLRLNLRRRKIMEGIGQKGMSTLKIQQAVRVIREARRVDLSGLKSRGINGL